MDINNINEISADFRKLVFWLVYIRKDLKLPLNLPAFETCSAVVLNSDDSRAFPRLPFEKDPAGALNSQVIFSHS